MTPNETQKILQAGQIAKQVKEYAKTIIKKDKPLLEIAEQIENKIIELGGKPAFPTNLSINEIAAHYTPSHNDETKAHGLLKIDLGVHVDGFIADTAFSIDLENSDENKRLIKASENALNNAIKLIKDKIELEKINDNKLISEKEVIDNRVGNSKSLGGVKIFFIDFGLGYISKKIEDKAVDIHLLKQALEAKHFKNWEVLFKSFLKGYSKSKDYKEVIERLKKVEARGRYKH